MGVLSAGWGVHTADKLAAQPRALACSRPALTTVTSFFLHNQLMESVRMPMCFVNNQSVAWRVLSISFLASFGFLLYWKKKKFHNSCLMAVSIAFEGLFDRGLFPGSHILWFFFILIYLFRISLCLGSRISIMVLILLRHNFRFRGWVMETVFTI